MDSNLRSRIDELSRVLYSMEDREVETGQSTAYSIDGHNDVGDPVTRIEHVYVYSPTERYEARRELTDLELSDDEEVRRLASTKLEPERRDMRESRKREIKHNIAAIVILGAGLAGLVYMCCGGGCHHFFKG